MLGFLPSWSSISAAAPRDDSFVLVDDNKVVLRDEVPKVFKLPNCNGLDLFEITIDELQHHFSNGNLTSVQYTAFCLENIRRVGDLWL